MYHLPDVTQHYFCCSFLQVSLLQAPVAAAMAPVQHSSGPCNLTCLPVQTNNTAVACHISLQVSLLQEPVGAAMAFGFGKRYDAELLLVFDLGGGTFDLSLVDSFEGIMEVRGFIKASLSKLCPTPT
jgi:hypothetical protein